MASQERTVKTLLLSKFNARLESEAQSSGTEDENYLFAKLDNLQKDTCEKYGGNMFATIGKVDAISMYNTLGIGVKDDNLMKHIQLDRDIIIQKTNENISYHPIHLIANSCYTTDRSNETCAVIALIYGVNATNALGTEPGVFKSYEQVIKEVLEKKISEEHVEIYNAINICDVVAIIYSNDLKNSLKIINSLNENGIARKTLSLICLPYNKELIDAVNNDTTESAIVKGFIDDNSKLSLRVEGSIRNQKHFDEYKHELEAIIQEDERKKRVFYTIVFGQSDFSLQLSDLNQSEVNQLFKLLLNKNKLMVDACWDAHTEFLHKPDPEAEEEREKKDYKNFYNDPNTILTELYRNYAKYSNSKEDYPWLKDLPWYDAFYVLLGVHANIDSDPVLHGPGYLVYRFVKVLLHYTSQYLEEKKNNIFKRHEQKDITVYSDILINSEIGIQRAIQGWGNLTDQILRIDDLIFHGFGNSSSLYNTLPECALDFYHAMILRVVEFVYKHDIYFKAVKNRVTKNYFDTAINDYCYDFLMLPSNEKSVTIDQLFDTDAAAAILDNPLNLSNPEKQIYLVKFPISKVYSPFNFFVQLVHECFHYFGDQCRLRQRRSEYLCSYITEWIIARYFKDLKPSYKNQLRNEIRPKLKQYFQNAKEPNVDRSKALLKLGLKDALSKEGVFRLRTIAKHKPALYFESSEELPFYDIWIDTAMYFFREGYADLMMAMLLGLSPDQYYSLFNPEEYKATAEHMIFVAQRMVLVSAVLCVWNQEKTSKGIQTETYDKWNEANVISTIQHYQYLLRDHEGNELDPEFLSGYMENYFHLLVRDSNDLSFKSISSDDLTNQTCPSMCMKEVMSYLIESAYEFYNSYENGGYNGIRQAEQWLSDWIKKAPSLENLRNEFTEFFVDYKLFNEHFFKIIYDDHGKVREMVNSPK